MRCRKKIKKRTCPVCNRKFKLLHKTTPGKHPKYCPRCDPVLSRKASADERVSSLRCLIRQHRLEARGGMDDC
jgi:hypothetical protein